MVKVLQINLIIINLVVLKIFIMFRTICEQIFNISNYDLKLIKKIHQLFIVLMPQCVSPQPFLKCVFCLFSYVIYWCLFARPLFRLFSLFTIVPFWCLCIRWLICAIESNWCNILPEENLLRFPHWHLDVVAMATQKRNVSHLEMNFVH